MKSSLLPLGLVLASFCLGAAQAIAEPTFSHVEHQFWIYQHIDGQAHFRFPWDAEANDVQYNKEALPDFAKACLDVTDASFKNALSSVDAARKMQDLAAKGATSKFLVLMNVIQSKADYSQLRQWDRDAYFYQWNDLRSKPSLFLSDFRSGFWVWEVVSWPGSCLQPPIEELHRYLDYVGQRLGVKN